jgi:hypothetical protein
MVRNIANKIKPNLFIKISPKMVFDIMGVIMVRRLRTLGAALIIFTQKSVLNSGLLLT